jgi:hypothetical protein
MRNTIHHSRLTSAATRRTRRRSGRRERLRRRLEGKSTVALLGRFGIPARKHKGRAAGCPRPGLAQRIVAPRSAYDGDRRSGAFSSRLLEQTWLKQHQSEYAGAWVALEGASLIAQGASPREVLEAAKAQGYEQPLVVHIPSGPALPFGGW